jgi:hypothetical protein
MLLLLAVKINSSLPLPLPSQQLFCAVVLLQFPIPLNSVNSRLIIFLLGPHSTTSSGDKRHPTYFLSFCLCGFSRGGLDLVRLAREKVGRCSDHGDLQDCGECWYWSARQWRTHIQFSF